MRVWVMSNEYRPRIIGGLGIVATNVTNGLARAKANVRLITVTRKPKIRIQRKKNLQIIRFPSSLRKMKKNQAMIANWLMTKRYARPDIIHVHSVNFLALARYYKQKYGVPIVYTCHSLVILEPKTRYRLLVAKRQEQLMRIADTIVVPSVWQEEKVKQYYPSLSRKVQVIENGIHVKKSPAEAPQGHLLYVGRITRMKGVEELLQAVSLLAKERQGVRLHIAGTGSDRYLAKLRRLTVEKGIRSKVRFLGFRPHTEVQKLYRKYGAVIVPSKQESFGLVALEALASGVPLVSTRRGGLSQFVTEEVAEVIPAVSGRSIAKSIENMWNDSELTQSRVDKGLEMAADYDWSRVTEKYLELFSNILQKG